MKCGVDFEYINRFKRVDPWVCNMTCLTKNRSCVNIVLPVPLRVINLHSYYHRCGENSDIYKSFTERVINSLDPKKFDISSDEVDEDLLEMVRKCGWSWMYVRFRVYYDVRDKFSFRSIICYRKYRIKNLNIVFDLIPKSTISKHWHFDKKKHECNYIDKILWEDISSYYHKLLYSIMKSNTSFPTYAPQYLVREKFILSYHLNLLPIKPS